MSGAPGTVTGPVLSAGPGFRAGAGSASHPRPHRLYAEMGAHPGAVPYARRCTRQALTAWRLGSIADDIELVVSDSLNLASYSLCPFLTCSGAADGRDAE